MARALVTASTLSCGGDGDSLFGTGAEQLIIYVVSGPPGSSLVELDSAQLAVGFVGGRLLPSTEVVSWGVSDGGLATVSATGLVKAIRATDFDRPGVGSFASGTEVRISATVAGYEAFTTLAVVGWRRPFLALPELDGIAYLDGLGSGGYDEAGNPVGSSSVLMLTCGTVAPGKWTVEVSPYDPHNLPWDRWLRVFASDTISVAFDDEPRRLERWERVGARLRAVDGVDMVRRMRRARTFAVTGRGYSAGVAPDYSFRLGNVERVTQSEVFRACR